MSRSSVILLALAVVMMTGCVSAVVKDIKVDAQADPKAKFSGYKTYAWLGSAAILNDPHGQWEPQEFDADSEVKFLIDRELRKRGMAETTSAPDMIVAFAAGINMDALELKVDPETKMEMLTNVPQGGIVVPLIDGKTGVVIWVGVASGEVQEKPTPETVKKRLDYAVTQLFKKLPG